MSTRYCKSCREARAKTCQACGQPLPLKSKRGGLCWECHVKRLGSQAQKTCSWPRCERPHKAKGLCFWHYQHERRAIQAKTHVFDTNARGWIKGQPCQLCGYRTLLSEAHRVIPKGPYIYGNMTALCANCHKEVHQGVTPCPEPLYPPGYVHPVS